MKEEIQELYLLNANPVSMPNTNKATTSSSETEREKKCPQCAIAKIPAVIKTLILGVVNFLIYC